MKHLYAFYWDENGGYRYSCACGFWEWSQAYHVSCPRCGEWFTPLRSPVKKTFDGAYVKIGEGKLGYWSRTIEYGASRPHKKTGARHVYIRRREKNYVVANLRTGKVYHVTVCRKGSGAPMQAVRVRNYLGFCPSVPAFRGLVEGFRTITGYSLERLAEVYEASRYGENAFEAVFGATLHPPLALIAYHSPSVFVRLGKELLNTKEARRPKLSASDPVGILEQYLKVSLGRSVLRVMEQIEEDELERLKESQVGHGAAFYSPYHTGGYIFTYAAFVRLVGPDLARRLILNRSIRESLEVEEMLGFYVQHLEPKTAVQRLIRLVEDGTNLWMLRDVIRMALQAEEDPREVVRLRSQEEIDRYHTYLVSLLTSKRNRLLEDRYQKLLPELVKLEHRGEAYMIRAPKNLAEITAEGRAMHHCAGSYVNTVAMGETAIYFLRTLGDRRVGTLEVKNGRLIQAFGPRNTILSRDALDFVLEWARVHGLDTSRTYGIPEEMRQEEAEEDVALLF